MNPRGRQICGGVAVALFVLMLWLFRSSPDIDFAKDEDAAAFSVECEPVMWGWGRTFAGAPDAGDLLDGDYNGYTVTSGEEPGADPDDPAGADDVEQNLAHLCSDARAGRAGLIGLFAFPAALLAAIAIIRFPREIRISRTVTAPPRAADES